MSIDWTPIAEAVVGTTMSLPMIADRFDVDEDEIEDRLLDEGVETCPGCGWWWDSFELDGESFCPDCTQEDKS